jgi:hypothetical protein
LIYKAFFLVVGAAIILAGIITVKDREARLSWGGDDTHDNGPISFLHGWPAVLVGIAEVILGGYLLSLAFKAS